MCFLKENKDRFQQGEIIQVELSFASTAKNKYQLDGAAITAFEGSNHLHPMLRDEKMRSAARVLRFLGTKDAARYMVQHFNEAESDFGYGLIGSPHREMVIKVAELEKALTRRSENGCNKYVLGSVGHLKSAWYSKNDSRMNGRHPEDCCYELNFIKLQ